MILYPIKSIGNLSIVKTLKPAKRIWLGISILRFQYDLHSFNNALYKSIRSVFPAKAVVKNSLNLHSIWRFSLLGDMGHIFREKIRHNFRGDLQDDSSHVSVSMFFKSIKIITHRLRSLSFFSQIFLIQAYRKI